MSYARHEGPDYVRLPLRTILRTFDFRGRSTRTEVVAYWIASYFLNMIFWFVLSFPLSNLNPFVAAELSGFILAVPAVALFARRTHDQNRSGWWSLLIPAGILARLPDLMHELFDAPDKLINYQFSGPHWWHAAQAAIGLALLVFALLPGTDGPNHFGEDPRVNDDSLPLI